jgi:hypothetical protein
VIDRSTSKPPHQPTNQPNKKSNIISNIEWKRRKKSDRQEIDSGLFVAHSNDNKDLHIRPHQ